MNARMLRRLLTYNPDTGLLFWKARTPDLFSDGYRSAQGNCANWNSAHAGKEAFTSDSGHGYLVGAVNYKKMYAHRAAWMIYHGDEPDVIDHINGNRSDNRICNLRSVDGFENARNSALKSTNKSGHVGVSWCRSVGKWSAKIQIDGKQKHLGVFERKQDAINARKLAQSGIYHEGHGRNP